MPLEGKEKKTEAYTGLKSELSKAGVLQFLWKCIFLGGQSQEIKQHKEGKIVC